METTPSLSQTQKSDFVEFLLVRILLPAFYASKFVCG
jgi:hypothetical protein